MTKRDVGVSLGVLLPPGAVSARADEPVLPFHATLQATEDCESLPNPEQCLGLEDWTAECLANGYNQAFQAVRTGTRPIWDASSASSGAVWSSRRPASPAPTSS